MASNQQKLDETHSQLNLKHSWLFTHIADTILSREIPWFGYDGKTQPPGQRGTTTLRAFLGWIDSGLNAVMRALNDIKASVDGLTAAVKATNAQPGIDSSELERLIAEAVQKSAGTYELRKVEAK